MSTVTPLRPRQATPPCPLSVMRAVPNLPRAARRDGLARLADRYVHGTPLHETDTAGLICLYAHPGIDDERALVMFAALVGELRRLDEWEPDTEFPEVPWWYEGDAARAMDDLLDNTDTYRGDR